MRDTLKPLVIMALNTDTATKELALIQSHGFAAKPVQGVYKGIAENSYVIECPDYEALQRLRVLAKQHNQESILQLDESRLATLYYVESDKVEYLGKFQVTARDKALAKNSYTFDPDTRQYYVVE